MYINDIYELKNEMCMFLTYVKLYSPLIVRKFQFSTGIPKIERKKRRKQHKLNNRQNVKMQDPILLYSFFLLLFAAGTRETDDF